LLAFRRTLVLALLAFFATTRQDSITMRTLPIDTNSLRMLATGGVQPVAIWVELADGSRRPDPNGRQESDDTGTPLWTVEALVPPMEEGDRAELISVRVAAHDQPKVTEFEPIKFHGLACRVGVNRRDGKLSQYWSANGVEGGKSRPAQAAS
jgi:hypothetical protein